jgi:hypothetical protein
MGDKLPFDPYDFFGYLAVGLVVVVGLDIVLGGPDLLNRDLKSVQIALLLIAVYVFGQLVATPAKAVLEDLVIDKILGRPSVNLFRHKAPLAGRILFPGYLKPLPAGTRKRILEKAESEGINTPGEELFLHVRYAPETRQDEKLIAKLDSFRDKYGFSRNMSFTLLVVGVGLTAQVFLTHFIPSISTARPLGMSMTEFPHLKVGVLSIVTGSFLFYRYLKFFRQYSYEMFNSYGASTRVDASN